MYISASGDYFAAAHSDVLTVYDSTNTANHRTRGFKSTISSLHAARDFVLVGLFSGRIFIVDKKLEWDYEIANLKHRVRCIFCCGETFYFGSEDAKIIVILIRNEQSEDIYYEDSDVMSDSLFTKSQRGFEHRVLNEIVHNAPIISIAVDGDVTYVLDMKGKVMVYPDRFAYDIYATCMSFKKYLFASEKNFLYCKTEEAFSCILTMRDDIVEFMFTLKGSILFVRTQSHLHIYNKHFKEIRKLSLDKCVFAFDEGSNRLVVFDGHHITFVNNIVESVSYLCEEMDNIIFEKTRINEKVVRNEEYEDNGDVTRFIDDGNGQIMRAHSVKKNKKNVMNIPAFNRSYERLDDSTDDETRHYNNKLNLFEDEEEEEEDESTNAVAKKEHIKTIKPFISGSFESDGIELLCYNKIGFVLRRKDEIEVIYHDTSIPRKCFNENYTMASLSEKGVLFARNDDVLVFNGDNSWEKDMSEIKLVSITNKLIICITDCEMHIFKFSGIKIFSCLVHNPITISSEVENIVLFCQDRVLFFDRDFNVLHYDFYYNLSFCVLEQNIIYYHHESYLYMFRQGIAIRLMKVNGYPLCINNSHLITCNGRITDTPIIEFYAIKTEDLHFNMALNHVEREIILVKQIDDALIKKDEVLMTDLIDLLRLEGNIEKYKYIRYSKPDIKEYEAMDYENKSNIQEEIKTKLTNEVYSPKPVETPIKTKRYNAFAKK